MQLLNEGFLEITQTVPLSEGLLELTQTVPLRNELRKSHGVPAAWGSGEYNDWAAEAERIGNKILEINPDLLIFVEGVSYALDLTGARSKHVELTNPKKLVYSGHVYTFRYFQDIRFSFNIIVLFLLNQLLDSNFTLMVKSVFCLCQTKPHDNLFFQFDTKKNFLQMVFITSSERYLVFWFRLGQAHK